jgi:hypothetical protein
MLLCVLQPEVALQALEFWSTLCEEEAEIKVKIT